MSTKDKSKENVKKPLWVRPETHQKAKLLAVLKGKTIKEVVEELVDAELKK